MKERKLSHDSFVVNMNTLTVNFQDTKVNVIQSIVSSLSGKDRGGWGIGEGERRNKGSETQTSGLRETETRRERQKDFNSLGQTMNYISIFFSQGQ